MTDPAVVALRDVLADRLMGALADLLGYLRRAAAAGQSVDAALDAYQWPTLTLLPGDQQVLDALARAYLAGSRNAAARLGVVWGETRPEARAFARQRAAELVGMTEVPNPSLVTQATKLRRVDGRWYAPNPDAKWAITDTTRAQVKQLVEDTLDTPTASYRDLYDDLAAMPAFTGLFGEQRAEMIARTELGLAMNHGAVDTYRSHGLDRVRVLDNPDCPICRVVAGTIQTVQWASENALGHPHCIRAFQPVEGAA